MVNRKNRRHNDDGRSKPGQQTGKLIENQETKQGGPQQAHIEFWGQVLNLESLVSHNSFSKLVLLIIQIQQEFS